MAILFFIVSKDYWDSYASNLPSESDIFSINWADLDLFTSYRSNPNIAIDTYGFKVNSDIAEYANNGPTNRLQTIIGSRRTDSISVSDNSIWIQDDYITKYLFNQEDTWSSQRLFLKADINSDCYQSERSYYNCNIYDLEILFFTPDKEELIGFKLGGYNGSSGISNVKIMLNNDEE